MMSNNSFKPTPLRGASQFRCQTAVATDLDFTTLTPEWTWTFMSLTEGRAAQIAHAPECLERLNGVLSMAYLLGGEKPGSKMVGTYFRGALCEFASIDDAAASELGVRLPLLQTTFPLPHILKLLRNVQLHLTPVVLGSTPMLLELRLEPVTPVEVQRWYVSDLSAERLVKLDAFKGRKARYTADQAKEMVAWFVHAQSHLGLPDLMRRAVEDVIDRFGKV